MDLFKGLDEDQEQVVKHFKGACSVASGAGSGKTTCYCRRIANLVTAHGVDPERILGVTFTKAAANEMQERLFTLLPKYTAIQVPLSTIHSWCYTVIAEECKEQFKHQIEGRYLVVEDREQARIINTFIEQNKLEKRSLEIILSAIGVAKNYIITPDRALEFFTNPPTPLQPQKRPDVMAHAYAYYQAELAKLVQKAKVQGQWVDRPGVGKIDFDDMMLIVHKLFKENPTIAKKWANKYDFVLVDESQDTSIVQLALLDMLLEFGGHDNIMCVGDLRQGIYSFRGASPISYQAFIRKYNAQLYNLRYNYRSEPEIIGMGNRIAQQMADLDDCYKVDMIHPTESVV